MSDEQLKDIIVALIENKYFPEYVDEEGLARSIAKFQKAYIDEFNK